jgi:hypothetical protein
MKRCAMIALAAFGALLATAPGALAQSPPDVTCPPYAGTPNTVHNLTDNKACEPETVTVTGNVMVGQGATFVVSEGGTISGNVQANNCHFVDLNASAVGGNVQIGNCESGGDVHASTVGGNFQCYNNTGSCDVDNSTILGNVQIMNNTSSNNPSDINNNTIAKDLQCLGNVPSPTSFLANRVGGNNGQNSEGQCKGF